MLTLRTHSSSFFISVSSSHGLTSSRMEDLAMRAGFLDFLAAYSARRCSFTLAASAASSSPSEPKRSMSSSLASFPEASVLVTEPQGGSQTLRCQPGTPRSPPYSFCPPGTR
uniref:Uncharacterized protein n=1 Tax=Takifugu rubripes TaxID=31033 RepID=A0A3B5K5N2_TAKRU